MISLINFLNELEKRKIYYKINKVREAIMVEIAVPGQRREVEFFGDNHIEVEKFMSTGEIFDERELNSLLRDF